MKKLSIILTALIFAVNINVRSQTQLSKWYIGPNQVDMSSLSPSASPIVPSFLSVPPHQALYRANGMYDNSTPNPRLIFYVADDSIFDYNNTFMGKMIRSTTAAAEIAIVPFGNNDDNAPCQDKYNVFSTAGGFHNDVALIQTIVDMKNFSVTSKIIDQMPYVLEFGAIAVSRALNTHDQRHLYFLALLFPKVCR